jgi:hypothetical protein
MSEPPAVAGGPPNCCIQIWDLAKRLHAKLPSIRNQPGPPASAGGSDKSKRSDTHMYRNVPPNTWIIHNKIAFCTV